MTGRFAGRRALVTGASRGIGVAVAEQLAAEGADVALTARSLEPGDSRLEGSLIQTSERLARYGTRIEVLAADLSRPEARVGLVERAESALGGPLDILINNAAAAIYAPLADYPLHRRQLSFEVNLHAPLDLMQQVLPGMRSRGEGWIVNLSSATSRLVDGPPFALAPPGTAMAVYGASKAALERVTNGLAAEVYGDGVRVNTVQPRSAVLSEGAAELVGATLRADQIESMEQMVAGVLVLCGCAPEFTGRACVSLDLLEQFEVEARGPDGRERETEGV